MLRYQSLLWQYTHTRMYTYVAIYDLFFFKQQIMPSATLSYYKLYLVSYLSSVCCKIRLSSIETLKPATRLSQLVCSEQGPVGNCLQSFSDNTGINHYKSSKNKHLSYKTDIWYDISVLSLFNICIWCPCNGIILQYYVSIPTPYFLSRLKRSESRHSPLCRWHKRSMWWLQSQVLHPVEYTVEQNGRHLSFPIIKTLDEEYLWEEWFHPSSRGL